nr:MAG TPA: hypothetical protein [Caudoviricetes sp.]
MVVRFHPPEQITFFDISEIFITRQIFINILIYSKL